MTLTPERIALIGTGLAVAALGVTVARVRWRELANRAFGAFAAGFGVAVSTSLVAATLPVDAPFHVLWEAATVVLSVASAGGLAVLVVSSPTPLPRRDRDLLALPGLLWGLGVAVIAWSAGAKIPYEGFASYPGPAQAWAILATSSIDVLKFGMLGGALLLALRFRRAVQRGEPDGPHLAFLAGALLLWPGAHILWDTAPILLGGDLMAGAQGLVGLALTGVVSVAWLGNTRVPSPGGSAADVAHRGMARNLAVFTWVPPLVGLAFWAAGSSLSPSAPMRVVMILLLAYAILRHQLLGLDVKVRWGISKGTVAGVFIAVVLVATEGAQALVGGENEWIGIAAAGLLVFALAPLQRAADRLAQAAVPAPDDAPPGRGPARRNARSGAGRDGPEAAYRDALALAMRDRLLTRDEEERLARLADHLGIPPSRSVALLREVEGDQMAREPQPP